MLSGIKPGVSFLSLFKKEGANPRPGQKRRSVTANALDYRHEEVASREAEELVRRERLYRGDRPAPEIFGRVVILIDDGLATGSSMSAAIAALRKRNPARIVVGVPVGAPSTCDEFRSEVDEIVCAVTPEPFYAVGIWYEDFSQTTDQEIHELLERADREHASHIRH